MTPWEWITTTASVDSLLTTLGVGTLAFLFARDLILTKGQHLRRVEDIVAAQERRVKDLIEHHGRELEEKERRATELRESRDGWKEAARAERDRADRAVAAFGDMADTLSDIQHVLESLNIALPTPVGGDHEPVR